LTTSEQGAIEHGEALRHAISGRLEHFDRVCSSEPGIPAAVALVVLGDEGGGACMPMFVRAARLARHAGQFGLPGGKVDAGEGPEAAAIRELREELGLKVEPEAVLGSLDDFDTQSGFTMTPVVIWGGGSVADLDPSRDEVAQLFLLALPDLRSAVAGARRGTSRAFCLELPWAAIYAPTAAILYQFSEVALDGRSTRVKDFYQPPFTHR
jgi:8-oxo-dGTP pyrophosphatase MutT (NUDIX family)